MIHHLPVTTFFWDNHVQVLSGTPWRLDLVSNRSGALVSTSLKRCFEHKTIDSNLNYFICLDSDSWLVIPKIVHF